MTRTHENSLRTYLLTRIALAVPTVLILLTMVFLLMRVAPGNPIQAALGGHVPQAQIQAREHRAGYDRPILTQYVEYLKDALTLNLGDSLTDHTAGHHDHHRQRRGHARAHDRRLLRGGGGGSVDRLGGREMA